MRCLALIAAFVCGPAIAGPLAVELLERVADAPVVIVGEVHDNPSHHAVQADIVAHLQPSAIVFEMLTEAQADLVTPDNRADQTALADSLDLAESGWPDFAMYHPIFTAAP